MYPGVLHSAIQPLEGEHDVSQTAALAATALLLAAGQATAQSFPAKSITLIYPWPAGGSTDVHLRKLAEIAAKHLGQPIIIENKVGASGMLGPVAMAKTAQPDGYVLSQLAVSAFRVPHMQKVDWDPLKDFTYIIGVSGYTFGVVVKSDSPFKTFNDLIDYAKANPGKMSFGSTGNGTSPHLLMEVVAAKGGVQFLHVPLKGNADSTQALRRAAHSMGCADREGTRHRHRLILALRDRWPERDGPESRQAASRCVQEGARRPRAFESAAATGPGVLVQVERGFRQVGAETLRSERATIERVGLLLK